MLKFGGYICCSIIWWQPRNTPSVPTYIWTCHITSTIRNAREVGASDEDADQVGNTFCWQWQLCTISHGHFPEIKIFIVWCLQRSNSEGCPITLTYFIFSFFLFFKMHSLHHFCYMVLKSAPASVHPLFFKI